MKSARLILVLVLLSALKLFGAPPAGYYLVWSDEFNGTSLDTTKWDYWLLGNRRDAVNTTAAVAVTGGNLVISTYTSGGVNYTAMVASDQKFRTKYGYWESSVEWGDTNGMWSAIWMQSPTMGANLNDPFTSGSEIDIAEHRYVDGSGNNIANQIQPNVHWNGYGTGAASSGGNNYGSGLATGFHTYGFLWTPTDYTISIDGSNVRNWNYSVNGVPVSRSTEWMIFSSEVDDTSTTWAGLIPSGGYGAAGVSGVRMTIDYARYYAPTSTLFWTGASSLTWNNSANWVSNMPLTSMSDVTFGYLSGNNLATGLTADTTIDGLTVLEMNNALSVGGSYTLTMGAGGVDTTSANHSVNLNSIINLGTAQTWQIGSAFPVNVNGNLTGTGALTKANAGRLNLNASNSFSGTLFVDSNPSGTLSDGMVVVANPNALANAASPIQIRNNNSCSSTLGFSGGGINLKQSLQITCRNNAVAALENISGTNSISGNILISQGGSNVVFQCDAGQFNILGNIGYNGSLVGARSWNFVSTGTNIVSGVISNSANGSVISLSQSGSGALILSNANQFTGTTTVSGGALFVDGSLGSGAVTVTGGALSGKGIIGGPVTVNAASLRPGHNGVGTLTVKNNVTLSANSTTVMELDKTADTNDELRVSGTLNYAGTLAISNLSAPLAPGDSFQLFNAATSSGNFSSISGSPGAGLAWKFNPASGLLTVYSTVSTNITATLATDQLILSWPTDHLGWHLQVQSNDAGSGLGTNWIDLPDTTTMTSLTNNIVPSIGPVFYRLVYP